MELRCHGYEPRGNERALQLLEKGVEIPDPLSVDIGEEVDPARISADGVVIFPGCRIYGSNTVISPKVRLGAEAPVTIEDCWLGPEVELRGGYFRRSVFLTKASMGSGAQVREGCLLEEEASGAHCVGLKQTILFPFATLGSLINFCDCLLAGGTNRKDHSEVGSSYVHFNFTPYGDKATPSLFGDVPRGVMLNQRPIFLGGQGGAVGPIRVEFGTVIAAGGILRRDVLVGGRLVVVSSPAGLERDWNPSLPRNLGRVVRNNAIYLGNLVALECWYDKVRRAFFAEQEMGEWVLEGALEVLAAGREERLKQLAAMAEKADQGSKEGRELRNRAEDLRALFLDRSTVSEVCKEAVEQEDEFLGAFQPWGVAAYCGYVEAIKGLAPESANKGIVWLQSIVNAFCRRVSSLVGSWD